MAVSAMPLPTGTDPVNEIALIMGLSMIRWPIVVPDPITRDNRPLGITWRSIISASATAEAGAALAGFQTTALPKARAGAILHEAFTARKFYIDVVAIGVWQ